MTEKILFGQPRETKAYNKKGFPRRCTIRLFKSIAKYQGGKQNGKYKKLVESYKMVV